MVLEVYISPSWTYLASDEDEHNPGSFAAGLTLNEPGSAPLWQSLAIQEFTDVPSKSGNTTVSKFCATLIVAKEELDSRD